jgi:hypothetical protein
LPLFLSPTAQSDSRGWTFFVRPRVFLECRFRSRIDPYRLSTDFCSALSRVSLRFGLMIRGFKVDSKLFASRTRHAMPDAPPARHMAQLGKGSFAAPRCIGCGSHTGH